MAAKRKKAKAPVGEGAREKVKFLTVLPAEAIRQLKLEALQRSTTEQTVTASSVLEEVVAAWLTVHQNLEWKPPEEEETGEKRQFKSQMDANVIRKLKIFAMDKRVTASTVVRKAVAEWLGRNNKRSQSEMT